MLHRTHMCLCALLCGCSEYNVGKEPLQPPPTAEDTQSPPDTTPSGTGTPGTGTPDTGSPDTGAPPAATAPVYAHTANTLYEIDPLALSVVNVGNFHTGSGAGIPDIVDIAINLSGAVYAGSDDRLYRVDPTTAEVLELCTLSSPATALTFTSDGVLFAGSGSKIITVDTTTCATTPLLQSSPYSTSGDLVGLPDGYLYWTVVGFGSDELVRVDPNTGEDSWIGEIGEQTLYGLGYALDNLYGFSSAGTITRIDPITGDGTEVYRDGTTWWGATTNPVVW